MYAACLSHFYSISRVLIAWNDSLFLLCSWDWVPFSYYSTSHGRDTVMMIKRTNLEI